MEKWLLWNPRIFRFLGVDVTCHVSLMIMLAALLILDWSSFLIFSATLLSVIPHEYGHVLMARRCGIGCRKILMTPFGGVAVLEARRRMKWEEELKVVCCGPLVTLGLVGIFSLLSLITFWFTDIFLILFFINLVLFVFNCIPCFPMDGARVVRALLTKQIGFERATWWTVRGGNILAVALIIFGVVVGWYSLSISMAFVVFLGEAELAHMRKEK